jgi:glycine cleavage system H lipoate-binding protein
MENKVLEFKKGTSGDKEKSYAKQHIDVDQPFDYADVTSVTGPEYVRHLNRDGIAFLPNEELKRNVVGYLLSDIAQPTTTKISGFRVADDYYHHAGHSWAQVLRGGWVRVGIDEFTSKVFGPVHTIRLPAVGDFLMQDDVGWVMLRNGHRAPVQSPVSGVVFAVNDRIKDHPELAHQDPYGNGWLCLLNPVSLEVNKKGLCSGKACFKWMEEENQRLLGLLGSRYEQMAATGGAPVDDIFGNCPDIDWDRLVKTFLRIG